MLICEYCGKVIANTNPKVHYGLCASCGPIQDRKLCPCGSGLPKRELIDARNIFCTFVCDKCVKEAMSRFRLDIFEDPNYETMEQVDEDN